MAEGVPRISRANPEFAACPYALELMEDLIGAGKISDDLSPPLKWAGGKRWLGNTVRQMWLSAGSARLVEPFVGGLAIALAIRPNGALLNDSNPHLINFYRWLKRGLKLTLEMRNESDLFYAYRAEFNRLIREKKSDTAEAASLFFYLNRTCFNGLCRFNSRGYFNVPFGRYKSINYERDFSRFVGALKNLDFENVDFQQLALHPNDFIYADPPYDVEFTSYSPGGFSWEDQVRLADWLCTHDGPIVASNQATGRIVDLYTKRGFEVQIVEGPRRISCTGDRAPAKEILATKGFLRIR